MLSSHQHVLCEPSLILGNTRCNAKRKALFPQQRVPSIATAEGQDLPGVWQVRYQHLVWVTGPRVDQGSCRRVGGKKKQNQDIFQKPLLRHNATYSQP